MNSVLESVTGMDKLNDQIIAEDFLIAAKTSIKNYSVALSVSTTPEVRNIFKKHLDEAISCHEKITNYMITKGYCVPNDPAKQFQMDIQAADTAFNLVK